MGGGSERPQRDEMRVGGERPQRDEKVGGGGGVKGLSSEKSVGRDRKTEAFFLCLACSRL